LGGVHFIEVHLQQKTVGGTEISVQSGGVHFIEVFTKGGFTVYLDHGDSHVKREHSLSEKKSLTSKINLFIYLSIFISFRIIFRKNKNKRN